MKTDSTKHLILELLDHLLNSWWTVVAGTCFGLAAAVAVLHFTPVIYEAGATVVADSGRILPTLIATTISDDIGRRLEVLRDAVLADGHVRDIVERTYGLPEDPETQRHVMDSVRSRFALVYVRGSGSFEVRFRDSNPDRAALVANMLADSYVEENAKLRVTMASDTTETLEELTQGVLQELQAKRAEITEFKTTSPQTLPEQMPLNMQLLQNTQLALEANLKVQAETQVRLRTFRAQQQQEQLIGEYTPGTTTSAPGSARSGSRASQYEAQLADLLTRYQENHPEVVRVKRLLAEAEAAAPAEAASPSDEPAMERKPTMTMWDVDILREQRELDKLQAEERTLRSQVRAYQHRVEQGPITKERLDQMSTGLASLQQKYDELRSKVESARTAQKIEEAQKGIQFEVVDRAFAPSKPTSPKPIPVYGMSIMAGLTLFVGPLLARRMLSPMINSEAGLRGLTELPVLVSLPRIHCPRMAEVARRRRTKNLGLSVLSAAVLAAAVVSFGIYWP